MSFHTTDLGCTAFSACDTFFESQILKDLMKSVRFDLALVDLKGNECGFKWISSFNIPTTAFWGLSFVGANSNLMRVGPNPFQCPQTLSRNGQKMSFMDLIRNLYLFCFEYVLIRYFQHAIPDMYSVEGRSCPKLEDLYENLEMIFVASGPLFE
ncbi:hypothetical protein TCAL_13957, partial [Tigriopus californicus]